MLIGFSSFFLSRQHGLNIDMLFTCSFGPQNKNNDCVAQTMFWKTNMSRQFLRWFDQSDKHSPTNEDAFKTPRGFQQDSE